MSNDYLLTSKSVSEGHPDKLADQISNAVLDAHLSQDKHSRVGAETLCSTGLVVPSGEITSATSVDYSSVVRETIRSVGYDSTEYGLDYHGCAVLVPYDRQSPDIAQAVDEGRGLDLEQGAGDQAMMFGYACNETPPHIEHATLAEAVIEEIIMPVLRADMVGKDTRYLVNPTGRFVVGGPQGDCGLMGRKIIVDTYGGAAPHGGGAFSGKDPSKVDRSGAYAARCVAKNLVAAGLATHCLVQLSNAIGVARPRSVMITASGSGRLDDKGLEPLVHRHFDLRPKSIVRKLDLLRPIYRKTAAHGHFGREEPQFLWERTGKAAELAADAAGGR